MSAAEMLIDRSVLSGTWERGGPYPFAGPGHLTDMAGFYQLKNSSGVYGAAMWVGLWGYGTVGEARASYDEFCRSHGGNYSGYLNIGENATLWYFDTFSQPIYYQNIVWDQAYSLIVYKMNYWIDITVAYNDDSGVNYDNIVQLAREQASRIG
jgi:hypothetical protein